MHCRAACSLTCRMYGTLIRDNTVETATRYLMCGIFIQFSQYPASEHTHAQPLVDGMCVQFIQYPASRHTHAQRLVDALVMCMVARKVSQGQQGSTYH